MCNSLGLCKERDNSRSEIKKTLSDSYGSLKGQKEDAERNMQLLALIRKAYLGRAAPTIQLTYSSSTSD